MTLYAVLTEAVIVYILVAAGAILMRNVCKLTKFLAVLSDQFVAFYAFNLKVFSQEQELGSLVTELRSRFELFKIVTGLAVG